MIAESTLSASPKHSMEPRTLSVTEINRYFRSVHLYMPISSMTFRWTPPCTGWCSHLFLSFYDMFLGFIFPIFSDVFPPFLVGPGISDHSNNPASIRQSVIPRRRRQTPACRPHLNGVHEVSHIMGSHGISWDIMIWRNPYLMYCMRYPEGLSYMMGLLIIIIIRWRSL